MRMSLTLRPLDGRPVPARDIANFAVQAESLGFHAIYLTDHLYYPSPNLHSVGAAVAAAAATDSIQIGFAAYQAPLRHPIAAAKELASLDILSDGRLIAGLAAGSYAPEFAAMGLPFKRRGAMLEEAVEAIKLLWTEDDVSFSGEFWSFEGVTIAPKPIRKPHPPIWLATWTAAPRAARRVARLADGWQASGLHSSADALPDGGAQIDKACEALGRDPAEIGRAYVNAIVQFAETPDAAWQELSRMSAVERKRDLCLLGDADDVARQIETLRANGMQEISFLLAPQDLETMKRIAGAIMPRFR